MNNTVVIPDIEKLDGCINTLSGVKFNLFNPTTDMICVEDIARGLAFNSHFNGQCPRYFSIAEHSLMVYDLIYDDIKADAGEHFYKKLLAGLLHDASEAYTGDMLKPLKVHLPLFIEVENRIMEVIFKKFNLDIGLLKFVKPYDVVVQKIEYRAFFYPEEFAKENIKLRYMTPENAYDSFLTHFNLLCLALC